MVAKPRRASATTTTTRPRQGPPPALGEAQRWAVELAAPHGWAVAVEARDGTRLELQRGAPGRLLVIALSAKE